MFFFLTLSLLQLHVFNTLLGRLDKQVENENPDSNFFDFKWSLNAQDIDQRSANT